MIIENELKQYSLSDAICVAMGCMGIFVAQNSNEDSLKDDVQEILDCMEVIKNWYHKENIEILD